jgi:hypothetical protein
VQRVVEKTKSLQITNRIATLSYESIHWIGIHWIGIHRIKYLKRLSKKKKKTALIDQINWIFRKTKKIGG